MKMRSVAGKMRLGVFLVQLSNSHRIMNQRVVIHIMVAFVLPQLY